MKNNNGALIRRLSVKSLRKNKMRNLFAAAAIVLTGLMFTVLFSLGIGFTQATQTELMREVGTKAHGGLKRVTQEQMEEIVDNPLVKNYSWDIFIGFASNLNQRQTEIRCPSGIGELENTMVHLEEGGLAQAKDEVVVDTLTLDELNLPHKIGQLVPLKFSFMGREVTETFRVSGWYEGDLVKHASTVYVSPAYWEELRGQYTNEEVDRWNQSQQGNTELVGKYQVHINFGNSRHIEKNLKKIIEDAGYIPDQEVEYGVNWGYISTKTGSMDPLTVGIFLSALLVILTTGYLIIYNVFQISIVHDIQFYGLLKTLGTTKRQLRRLVRRQVMLLCAGAVPLGMLLGYQTARILMPLIFRGTDYEYLNFRLQFSPWIFLFSGVFSAVTVWLSSRKPSKIAGKVSPVEAVKYVGTGQERLRARKNRLRNRLLSMALSNMGRSRKKTVMVVSSLTLSVLVLSLVMTAAGSFKLDAYLNDRIIGDFILANTNYTLGSPRELDFTIDEEYLRGADAQKGVTGRQDMYLQVGAPDLMPAKKTLQRYRDFYERGQLKTEEIYGGTREIEKVMDGRKGIAGHRYAYDTELLQYLKVVEGQIDLEKFETGKYVLVTVFGEEDPPTGSIYQPGEQITIELLTESSKPDIGEEGFSGWSDTVSKVYEVMAVVEIPASMSCHSYVANGLDLILPREDLLKNSRYTSIMAVSYEVEENSREAFLSYVDSYIQGVNSKMGCVTRESLAREYEQWIGTVRLIGVSLSFVVSLIAVLNFINSILTGIHARRQEFAVLRSVGMTQDQLKKMLILEGLVYVILASAVSLVLGILLSFGVVKQLEKVILFFQYQFTVLPYLIVLPAFFAVAVLVPLLAYRKLKKESLVEQLRRASV